MMNKGVICPYFVLVCIRVTNVQIAVVFDWSGLNDVIAYMDRRGHLAVHVITV